MITKIHQKKQKFINSINYFRGLAIVLIVLGHSYDLAHWEVSNNLESLLYISIKNATVYFIFISGFLYHYIFYRKFDYPKFMRKKAQYVLLPYLIISVIPIVFTVSVLGGGESLPDSLRDRPLIAIIWFFITGKVVTAYWYIPMAMLLFASSPLVNLIIRANRVLPVALLMIPISMIIHRPVANINALQSLVYFFPVYLIGVWSSINNKKIYAYLKDNKKKMLLVLIAIAMGIIQVWVFNQEVNFQKNFWSVTVPDVNLLQKISLCFLFMSLLNKYEDTNITAINKIAETSFAIYFIHPFLVKVLSSTVSQLGLSYEGNFFTLVCATLVTVLGCMAIAFCVKAVFKKNSRYLIGW